MKKTLYHIGMLAVAAFAFVACNKENEIVQPKEEVTHVATISLGKAIDTKTAVVEGATEASYKWLDDDAQYLHIFENGTAGEITSFSLNDDKTIATLTVNFTGTPTEPYTYEAKYAKTLSSSKNPLILNEQNPGDTSYDPAADVLVSKATSDVTSVNSRLNSFTFTMGRVVTVNKMTLTGLGEGEVISSVEFTLDKHMAGYVSYDDKNSCYSYSTGGTKLTMIYTPANGTVPASGQFPVYFISAPVNAAGIVSVVVTTDKKVYTKSNSLTPNPFEGKTITFAIGTMKRFTMGMSGYGETISEGTVYTLVESTDDIFPGANYIITAADVNRAIQSYTSGNNHKAVTIEKNTTNNTVTIDNTIDAEVFTINSVTNGYTIQNVANNKYLNSDSANNRLTESNTSESFTISISDGTASIVSATNVSRGYMYYNGTDGTNGNLFNCYADKSDDTSGNFHLLSLYVDNTTCIELDDAELAYNVTSPIEVAWANKDSFVKPTLSNPHSLTVTYSSSNENVATVDSSTGDVTFVGNGTTTITASSAKTSQYKAGSAEYQIIVTGAPVEKGSLQNPFTVAEAIAAYDANNSIGSKYVKGIVCQEGSSYCFISDDGTTTTKFELYNFSGNVSSSALKLGDAVIVHGTLAYYSNGKVYETNGTTVDVHISKPTFTPNGGEFVTSQSVAIVSTGSSSIRYTTDGTTLPAASVGDVYSGALNLTATTTVTAVGVSENGLIATSPSSATFTKVAPAFGASLVDGSATTSIEVPAFTTSATVYVTGNVAWTASAGSGVTLGKDSGTGADSFTISFDANTNENSTKDNTVTISTTAEVSIKSYTLTITQLKKQNVNTISYSLTPNASSTGSSATSYITSLTSFNYNGVSWKMNQWNPSTLQVKTNQSNASNEFRFYNTSAFSGRITKVVIKFSALTLTNTTDTGFMFVGGSSEVSATTGGTAGTWDSNNQTITWTPNATDNFTYFAFYQNGKVATGTNKLATDDAIVVTYEN